MRSKVVALIKINIIGILTLFDLFPTGVNASPGMGKEIIKHQYAMLMEICSQGRILNKQGQSNYSSLARKARLGAYIDSGVSSEIAVRLVNGVAWATKKECPDIW